MAKARKSVLPVKESPETLEWLWHNARFAERYPGLYEFLAAGMYEGDHRKPGTVTLFVANGRLKASFVDRHTQHAFYAILEPLEDLLGELEVVLTGAHEPWQPTNKNPAKPVF